MDQRSLRPPDVPNGNDPPTAAPGTVGPPSAQPGDPDGVQIDLSASGTAPPRIMRPAAWSGWPAEWSTSWNGQLATLADTAWLCLDLNSSILASMPPYLIGASASLGADWLTNPDPDRYSSWQDFAKQLCWDYQLGEAFVLTTARYATGYPARFHAVEPWAVEVELTGAGRRYWIGRSEVTDDLLHIRYRTRTSCARGEGPLDAGQGRLVAAEVLGRYMTQLIAGGGIVPSTLTHPDELSSTQATDLQQQWIAARAQSFGVPAVLSGGVQYSTVALSPADMALLDLTQFTESRIAVLLGVPPFLVGLPSGGDPMTYSNVTQVFDFHWRGGLRPKASAICAALSGWLLPRGTVVEVNRDEYVRPDPYVRAQTAAIYIDKGVLTAEEVRAIERFGAGAAPITAPVEGAVDA